MKVIYKEDFKRILMDKNVVYNKIIEEIKTKIKTNYNCKIENVKGGFEIFPLSIQIPKKDIKDIFDTAIKNNASDGVKLLKELYFDDYFDIE